MINVHNDPLFAVLLDAEYLRRGIVPIRPRTAMGDISRDMSKMTLVEQRAAKRKFRKAWRSAAKASRAKDAKKSASTRASTDRYLTNELGLGHPDPSRRHKRNRKMAVAGMIREKVGAAREALRPTFP